MLMNTLKLIEYIILEYPIKPLDLQNLNFSGHWILPDGKITKTVYENSNHEESIRKLKRKYNLEIEDKNLLLDFCTKSNCIRLSNCNESIAIDVFGQLTVNQLIIIEKLAKEAECFRFYLYDISGNLLESGYELNDFINSNKIKEIIK